MDSAPQDANVPPVFPTSAGQSPPPQSSVQRVLIYIVTVVLAGLAGGGVIALVLRFLPFTRVVVRNQPVSSVIKVDSARIVKDGFIALYINFPQSGLQIAGFSTRLRAGYYRNIVIPISRELVYPGGGREFIVRVFADDGSYAFNEKHDTPIKNMRGGLYQKRFWFSYPGRLAEQWFGAFMSSPLSMLGDTLIP